MAGGACVVGGTCSRGGHVCVAGETATVAGFVYAFHCCFSNGNIESVCFFLK